MFFSGFSSYELSSHIQDLRSEFVSFKQQQQSFEMNILRSQEKVIKYVQASENNFYHKLAQLSCEIGNVMSIFTAQEFIRQWEVKLQTLFYYVNRGSVGGKLSPGIFPIEYLKKIIQDHPELNHTIYRTSIYNFYRVAEVVLANVDVIDQSVSMHYVIKVPIVSAKNTFQLYKVLQVGVRRNNQCAAINLLVHVYKNGALFYALDMSSCKSEWELNICYESISQHTNHLLCLQNFTNCIMGTIPCISRSIFDKSGVMVSGVGDIRILHTNKSIVIKPLNENGVRFIAWENVSMVQLDEHLIDSPDFMSTSIQANFSTEVINKWHKFVNSTINNTTMLKPLNLWNSIEEMRTSLDRNSQTHASSHHLKTLAIVNGVIAMVGALLTSAIICICVITAKQSYPRVARAGRSEEHHESMELSRLDVHFDTQTSEIEFGHRGPKCVLTAD